MVIGIEMNAPAVADAQRNAEINGIKNCRFVCAKAEAVMDSLLKEYLDMPTEMECDISGNVSDKTNGNITNEHTIQPEEKEANPSLSANESEVEDDTVKECQKQDNRSTTSLDITKTNGCSEINKDENVPKQFKDVVAIVDPPRSGLHPVVIKALRTHPCLRRLVYISCNPETLIANAIELCTPSNDKSEKGKGNKGRNRHMGNIGLARQRAKSMPMSEAFSPVKAMAVDLFPHTPHCEMVMLFER
uniref:Methyltransferase domain-containing protein n=1 Tax=Araucaria cunninghamii TaxID=56994 RepID=A0A0D6R868_ARACU